MKIDVTDLFDGLFAVANLAYRDFFDSAIPTDDHKEPWSRFCCELSDSYFVALAARRAYLATHEAISLTGIKRRIITQVPFGPRGTLLNMWYESPRFFHSVERPSGFAANFHHDGVDSIREFLPRPEYSLTLHLGRIPATKSPVRRPEYDPRLTLTYFCQHGVPTMFSGQATRLFETRGEWLIREVTISNTLTSHEWQPPRWIETTALQEIPSELFHQMWELAVSNR